MVIDVRTGEILVAANYPSYNLQTYNEDYAQLTQDPLHPLMNRGAQRHLYPRLHL